MPLEALFGVLVISVPRGSGQCQAVPLLGGICWLGASRAPRLSLWWRQLHTLHLAPMYSVRSASGVGLLALALAGNCCRCRPTTVCEPNRLRPPSGRVLIGVSVSSGAVPSIYRLCWWPPSGRRAVDTDSLFRPSGRNLGMRVARLMWACSCLGQ